MIRDIRFRAWNKKYKEMVYFDNDKVKNDQFQAHYLAAIMAGDFGDVLMQFTGLQDKNGKDIFEGDLLRNESGRVCVVKWLKFAGWDTEPVVIVKNDNWEGFQQACWGGYIDKIGDIHTTPELLKGEI